MNNEAKATEKTPTLFQSNNRLTDCNMLLEESINRIISSIKTLGIPYGDPLKTVKDEKDTVISIFNTQLDLYSGLLKELDSTINALNSVL